MQAEGHPVPEAVRQFLEHEDDEGAVQREEDSSLLLSTIVMYKGFLVGDRHNLGCSCWRSVGNPAGAACGAAPARVGHARACHASRQQACWRGALEPPAPTRRCSRGHQFLVTLLPVKEPLKPSC